MDSFEVTESQEVNPLANVLEDLNPPQVQNVTQSSNAHSMEGIYAAVKQVNFCLKSMERHLLFLQAKQAQTSQTLTDMLFVLINMFSSSS